MTRTSVVWKLIPETAHKISAGGSLMDLVAASLDGVGVAEMLTTFYQRSAVRLYVL